LTCLCVCVFVYMCVFLCVCIHVCVYIYIYIYICMYIYVCAHVFLICWSCVRRMYIILMYGPYKFTHWHIHILHNTSTIHAYVHTYDASGVLEERGYKHKNTNLRIGTCIFFMIHTYVHTYDS
jgi:hypothetical protein